MGSIYPGPHDLSSEVDKLVEAGLIIDPSTISRRKVLATGGAAWTAATVATFALADPAAAATSCPGGVVPTSPTVQKYTTAGNYTYVTGFGVTSLMVRAWGAGGGGGGGGGAAGGGGAYAYTPALPVTACTAYSVVVGTNGTGGGSGKEWIQRRPLKLWARPSLEGCWRLRRYTRSIW